MAHAYGLHARTAIAAARGFPRSSPAPGRGTKKAAGSFRPLRCCECGVSGPAVMLVRSQVPARYAPSWLADPEYEARAAPDENHYPPVRIRVQMKILCSRARRVWKTGLQRGSRRSRLSPRRMPSIALRAFSRPSRAFLRRSVLMSISPFFSFRSPCRLPGLHPGDPSLVEFQFVIEIRRKFDNQNNFNVCARSAGNSRGTALIKINSMCGI